MIKTLNIILLIIGLATMNAYSQNLDAMLTSGRISGNFQLEAQSYSKDSLIGASDVKEKVLSNGFLNLNYNLGGFSAGLRYESYMNPLLGFDPQYKGNGIPYKYATWNSDFIQVTVGDFYEQFGSGMIFRAYEERALGLDNAVNGFRVKLRPTSSVELTALIGTQRSYWGQGDGIIRGGDINVELNDALSLDLPFNAKIGASVISKFQNDGDPFYFLPENVMAYSTRLALSGSNFLFDAEYGMKYNDPNATNNFSYNNGYGLILSGSYFVRGFSIALSAHKLDNMDYRSDRSAVGNNLMMGYIPPINKQSPYKLPNMFPFSTKLNGEVGIQGDINYVLPAKSLLGGKYGTSINVNYSRISSIDTTHTSKYLYDSDLFSIGDKLYYQDFNVNVSKKISSSFKTSMTYMNISYDKDILENEGAKKYGQIQGNILIADGTFKFDNRNALRLELQHLWATEYSTWSQIPDSLRSHDNKNGNWALALLEYSYSPKWFVSVSDEYNYGNDSEERQLHYYTLALTYVESSSRVQLSWGRQKEGILCVGGVCRVVPASNGVYLSLSTSF